jgi:hypothetical protein
MTSIVGGVLVLFRPTARELALFRSGLTRMDTMQSMWVLNFHANEAE